MNELINLYQTPASDMSRKIGMPGVYEDTLPIITGEYHKQISEENWNQACAPLPPLEIREEGKTYQLGIVNLDDPRVADMANHMYPRINSVDALLNQLKETVKSTYSHEKMKHFFPDKECTPMLADLISRIEQENRESELLDRTVLNIAASILHHDYLENPQRVIFDSESNTELRFGITLHQMTGNWYTLDITGESYEDKTMEFYRKHLYRENQVRTELNRNAITGKEVERYRIQLIPEEASVKNQRILTYAYLFRTLESREHLLLFDRINKFEKQLTRSITPEKYRERLEAFARLIEAAQETFHLNEPTTKTSFTLEEKLQFIHWSFFFYHLECDYHLTSIYQLFKKARKTNTVPQLSQRAILSVWGSFNWMPPSADGSDRHSVIIDANNLLHDNEAIPYMLASDSDAAKRWFTEYSFFRVIEAKSKYRTYYEIQDRKIQLPCEVRIIHELFEFFYDRYPIIRRFSSQFDIDEIYEFSKHDIIMLCSIIDQIYQQTYQLETNKET